MKHNWLYGSVFFLLTLLLLTSRPAYAGANAGFSAALWPTWNETAAGDTIAFAVRIDGAVEAKHALVVAQYDSLHFAFVDFAPGDLIVDMVAPAGVPEPVDGGRKEIQSGGTQLQGTPGSGSGTLGTLRFVALRSMPVNGLKISIVEIQLGAAATDVDTLRFAPDEFGFRAARRQANKIFNVAVERRHDGADIAWESRWPGINDSLRYRAVGDSIWTERAHPLFVQAAAEDIAAVRALQAAGIEAETAPIEAIEAELGASISAETAALYAALDRTLRTRQRVFALTELAVDTQYEYQIWSTSLSGQFSPVESGLFRTRLAPDRRPVVGTDLDIQVTTNAATATWFTNRPADTRFSAVPLGELFPDDDPTYDAQGALVHLAQADALQPDTEYAFRVVSELVGVESLVEAGLMSADQTRLEKTGTFRTKKSGVPLRFLGPPTRVISADGAIISFRLNQLAGALVDYGLIREDGTEAVRYDWSAASADVLNAHSVTLAGLQSTSSYRYRIRVVSPEGDTLSTDPSGDQQWNRDLQLRTSAAGDTLPPVLIEGPVVVVRDVLAVVRFTTDVETKATVFFGTSGGTYGTPDEFEVVDRTSDGGPRFAREHSVTISGLEPGADYTYGVLIEGANGKTASFEPSLGAAKRAGILQPPGGAGSFTTRTDPDTQFPVILTGPTVTSKTHDTAVVEWTTDEPANSSVRFGIDDTDGQERSGANALAHKLVLSNLEPGTTYRYVVASTDAVGNGATESALARFTTNREVDLTAPTITEAPAVLYASDRVATLQWHTDEDAKAVVEFGPTAELGFIRELPSTGRRHEIALTNLAPSTTYFYKISVTDLSNNGPTESALLQFTTDATADLTPPELSAIGVAASDSTAIVRWDSDELADSFVEFGTDSLLIDQKVGDTKDVLAHEVTLTNLQPSTRYFYRVGSTDRANNPPTESPVQSFLTLAEADTVPPSTPFDLRATPGARQVILTWDAALELDLNGFNIYRRAGGPFELITSGLQQTRFTDPNVDNDSTYAYYVTAIDRQMPPNESLPSASVSVVPTASAAPSKPSQLSRTGDFLRPTFVFTNATPFARDAELTYTIQVSSRPDFSRVTASVSGVASGLGQTSWTPGRNLIEGRTYYWRVRAVEGALAGPFAEGEAFAAVDPSDLVGDFNGDGSVLFDDFFLFVDYFGQTGTGEAEPFDLDGSGSVDFGDFFLFVDNFGRSVAAKRWAGIHALDEQVRFALDAHLLDERGAEVVVRLSAEEVRALRAFGAVLEYDPSEVVFERAAQGADPLLERGGGYAPLFGVLSQRPGHLVLGNGLVRGAGAEGDGPLAELHFRLQGAGRAPTFVLREGYVAASGADVRAVGHLGTVQVLPQRFALYANFPNPFNPSTSIEYALPQAAKVELVIYDILGRPVRTLAANTLQSAGFYRLAWDGRDEAARAVASGVYLYRLRAAGETPFVQTRKMMLIK